MKNKDWRLQGQEKYLKDAQLRYCDYGNEGNHNDHDHCEFCWGKFGLIGEDMKSGYCTLDRYHWICENCFSDFKDLFNWIVTS